MSNEEEELLITELCQFYSNETIENPSLLRFLSLIFLKFRKYDLESARERLGNYLRWRRHTFHNLNDQTIDNNDRLKEQIQSSFLIILKSSELDDILPDGGGAIVYLELKQHNTELYTADDTIKTWHYHIMCALKKNPELASQGFYMTGNLTGVGYSNLDIRIPHAIAHAISDCMPVRVCQFFLINPPYIAQMIIPVIKMLLSTKLSHRLNIITDLTQLTHDFHIPLSCLPSQLGGEITKEIFYQLIDEMIEAKIPV